MDDETEVDEARIARDTFRRAHSRALGRDVNALFEALSDGPMSLKDFASLLGYSPSMMSNLRNGKLPSSERLDLCLSHVSSDDFTRAGFKWPAPSTRFHYAMKRTVEELRRVDGGEQDEACFITDEEYETVRYIMTRLNDWYGGSDSIRREIIRDMCRNIPECVHEQLEYTLEVLEVWQEPYMFALYLLYPKPVVDSGYEHSRTH